MVVVAPFMVRTGRSFRPWIASGDAFMRTVYSVSPIFAVPEGRIRFCVLTAFTTSAGEKTRAGGSGKSRAGQGKRDLPPVGKGVGDPGGDTTLAGVVVKTGSYSRCSG